MASTAALASEDPEAVGLVQGVIEDFAQALAWLVERGQATAPDATSRHPHGGFMLAAFVGWFGFEYLRRRRKAMPETPEKDEATPLDQRIEQMLTEARVVLPGVQAMLGFDLLVTFTRAFEQLSGAAKAVSGACLRGADDDPLDRAGGLSPHYLRRPNTEEMHRIGSFLVTSAPLPLGLSIGANAYVAAVKITQNAAIGAALAGTLCVVLLCLWYAMPFMRRRAVPG
jgi:hypothetical protein